MKNLPLQISVREASSIYGISINTLRAYVHRRIIPHRKVRGRVYFVTKQLDEWLSSFDVETINGKSND